MSCGQFTTTVKPGDLSPPVLAGRVITKCLPSGNTSYAMCEVDRSVEQRDAVRRFGISKVVELRRFLDIRPAELFREKLREQAS